MVSLLDNIARPSAVILQLCVVLGVIFVLLKVVKFYKERKKILKALEAFPGPPAHWLYGHNRLVRTELGWFCASSCSLCFPGEDNLHVVS